MRHLLGIEDLSAAEATSILQDAEAHLAELRAGAAPSLALRGQTVINLFFEASTRTRTSFEIAAARLGAAVVNISPQTSSVTKGETLLDTVRTLDAMRPCALVVRHATSGAPHLIARNVAASVVNAGDGAHEHPTQALLDAFTILCKKPRLEGLVVAICGDLAHSRVARSNALLLAKLGARVRLAAPRTLLPPALGEVYGAEVFDRLEPALAGADVVMMLRVQLERLAGAALPSMGEYARTFGLTPARLALAKADALVMHPGPMNRGVEIQGAVADGPQSVVLEQVESGVAVRAAVLSRLARAALAPHSSSPGAENSSSSARSATSRSTSVPANSPSSHRSTCSRSPAGSVLAGSRASTRSAAHRMPAARRTPRSSSPDSARPYDCSAARVSSRSPRTSGRSDFARTSGGPGSGKSCRRTAATRRV